MKQLYDTIFEPDCFLTQAERIRYNDLLSEWSLESDDIAQEMLDAQLSTYIALAYERYVDTCERKGGEHNV